MLQMYKYMYFTLLCTLLSRQSIYLKSRKKRLCGWSSLSALVYTSLNSTLLQCAASDRILAVSTALEHRPQQCPCHTGRSGMGHPAQSILQLEPNDPGGLGMHLPHLSRQSNCKRLRYARTYNQITTKLLQHTSTSFHESGLKNTVCFQ